jgi:hypothetical protein
MVQYVELYLISLCVYICLPLQLAGGDVAGINNDSGDSVVQEASIPPASPACCGDLYRPDKVQDDAHPLHAYILVLLN